MTQDSQRPRSEAQVKRKPISSDVQVEQLRAAFELEKQRLVNRGHWVGVGIGVLGSTVVALASVFLGQKDPAPPPKRENLATTTQEASASAPPLAAATTLNGRDISFLFLHLYSLKLYERKEKSFDDAWDGRCKSLATDVLLGMQYNIFSLPSARAVRGEASGLTLGVQCFSGYDHAIIYGVSSKNEYPRLEAAGQLLAETMKLQWKEFQE